VFPDWQEYQGYEDAFLWEAPTGYEPMIVYRPQSWLLREGWKKSGAISAHAVPSKRR
jgi:hypothetical protein